MVRPAPLQLFVQQLLAQPQQLWAGKEALLGWGLVRLEFLLRGFGKGSKQDQGSPWQPRGQLLLSPSTHRVCWAELWLCIDFSWVELIYSSIGLSLFMAVPACLQSFCIFGLKISVVNPEQGVERSKSRRPVVVFLLGGGKRAQPWCKEPSDIHLPQDVSVLRCAFRLFPL